MRLVRALRRQQTLPDVCRTKSTLFNKKARASHNAKPLLLALNHDNMFILKVSFAQFSL